jgi:hypothetical protein
MKVLKIMKNIKVNESSSRLTLIAGFMLLALFAFLTGCSTGDLSRGQTVMAISEAANYKTPAVTSIDIGSLPNSSARAWQLSKEDTAEAAIVRAKEDFKKKQPQVSAAEHLGYIKLIFENPKLGRPEMNMPTDLYAKDMGVWIFDTRAELTDEGRALWKEANLNVNELALPLAVRGTPEITGIVEEDKITKKVELTYTWKPNKLGQSLDPNSAAFAELPEDLKQILKNPKFNIFGTTSKMVNFTQARKGIAYFKKYDDGWRIQNLTLV